uniref:hypothetical protein n=1 Tax=Clavibacter michiganensis TaxID=28447 RepID=UPI00374E1D18
MTAGRLRGDPSDDGRDQARWSSSLRAPNTISSQLGIAVRPRRPDGFPDPRASPVPGAVIGGLVMGVLNQGLSILSVDAAWQQVIKGLV